MKLEAGMYVRYKPLLSSKYVKINKIKEIEEKENCLHIWLEDKDLIIEKYLIKASYKIIDLIEEKDLLEIEYFSLRYEERVTRLFEVIYKEGRFINLGNEKCQFMLIDNDWTDNDKELEPIIKSIVTHEQMEQIAYKVG